LITFFHLKILDLMNLCLQILSNSVLMENELSSRQNFHLIFFEKFKSRIHQSFFLGLAHLYNSEYFDKEERSAQAFKCWLRSLG
jgi:hypothetical protein